MLSLCQVNLAWAMFYGMSENAYTNFLNGKGIFRSQEQPLTFKEEMAYSTPTFQMSYQYQALANIKNGWFLTNPKIYQYRWLCSVADPGENLTGALHSNFGSGGRG